MPDIPANFRKCGGILVPAGYSPPRRRLRGGYNSASRSDAAMANFAGSDMLNADDGLIRSRRLLIASRARNEFCNNSYAYGIIWTLANDTIGTGPRLQLVNENDLMDEDEESFDRLQRREARFHLWAQAVHLDEILRMARLTKAIDGETFIVLAANPGLGNPIILQPTLRPAENVASLMPTATIREYHETGEPLEVDGIRYDRNGNPLTYRFWPLPPECPSGMSRAAASTEIQAQFVVHYANRPRVGQHRGVSEMSPALHVFNDMRRYSTAVVLAAEIAARVSFIITNQLDPQLFSDKHMGEDNRVDFPDITNPDDAPSSFMSGNYDSIVLPDGYDAKQMRAEQPTSQYQTFLKAKIEEAARVFQMPFNVAAGNSSSYNYASGRLDHQTYHKALKVERSRIEDVILSRVYAAWESFDRPLHWVDYVDEGVKATWMWDGFEHVDPVKEANAQAIRLANGVTTLAEECAREGRDYLAVIRQRRREHKLFQKHMPDAMPPWLLNKSVVTSPDSQDTRPEKSE